ncbi:MAG TPA: copper resistance protein CopC [Usitatibacter sp.]|nr:copper resistance protein CopC [Usitatibacter sp.]
MSATSFLARVAAAAALATCSGAWAHPFLDHASPRVGGAVERSPERISLWFTEPLEPAFSWVKVLDANGRQVDRGDKQVDGGDPTHMHVSVPPLPAGTYRVAWRAISRDTHVTEGDFNFEVKR